MNDNCVDVRSRERERLGKFQIEKLIEFFKSLEPFKSQQELNIIEQMYKEDRNNDDNILEGKLKNNLFVNGNDISDEDVKLYEESYKTKEISASSYPNIFKWKKLVELASLVKNK